MTILPEGHALAKKASITPQELFQYPLISTELNSEEDLEKVCRISGAVPDIVLRAKSEFTILALVAYGMGVAIVPNFFVLRPYPGIVVRDLDCEYHQRTLGIAMLSYKELSPSSKEFIDSLPTDWDGFFNLRIR